MRVRTRPRLVTPTFALISLASLAYFLADGTLIPTVPLYVEGPLGGGNVAVGVAVGAFAVSALLLRPWAGRLSDRRGRRLLIVAGPALFGGSVLAYLGASNLPAFVAARLLTGAGEAFFFVGAATAVTDMAPEERRGEAVSLFSLSLYLGIGVGPLLGESVLGDGRFSAVWALGGGLAALAGLVGLLVPETRPETEPDAPPARTRLLHPAAIGPGLVILSAVAGMAGVFAFVPLYAPTIGLSGSRLVFLAYSGVVILIRSFGARIPDVLGPRTAGRLALGGFTAGLVTMGLWRSPAGLFAGTVVSAMGAALSFPALLSLAVSGVPARERGSVLGTFTAFVDLGFGAGPVILGAVAEATSYPGAFLAASGFTAAGLLALLRPGPEPAVVEVPEPAVEYP